MDSQPIEIVEKFVRRIGKNRTRMAYWLCQKTWKHNHKHRELRLSRDIKLMFNNAEEISRLGDCLVKVRVFFIVVSPTGTAAAYSDVNVIREERPYETSVKGRWGVNPISFLRWTLDGSKL